MLLFTFLPISEIDEICSGDINKAKERLAYEVTKEIHGKEEADKALEGAKAAFSGTGDKSSMPTVELEKSMIENKYLSVYKMLCYEGCVEFILNIFVYIISNLLGIP